MSQANVDLVRSLYDALESGENDSVVALIDDETVAYVADGLPWSGTYHGKQGFLELLKILDAHVQFAFETDEVIDARDSVVQIGHAVGEVMLSGRRFNFREVHVWGVREGRIVSLRNYSDFEEQRRQLGFTPE